MLFRVATAALCLAPAGIAYAQDAQATPSASGSGSPAISIACDTGGGPNFRTYTVNSPFQKGPDKLEVLLPDNFSPNKRYRVTYLLPVNTGTTGQWGSGIVEARKNNLQNAYGMIFVAPAYDVMPWFGDNPAPGGPRQNDYILKVVIPFMDKEFPTIAEARGRFLVGFSKSGLGAWALFLMHPDVFDQVALFDSYEGQPSDLQWKTWGFQDTYGTRENFDRYEPLSLLQNEKETFPKDRRRITIIGGGPGSRIGVDAYRARLTDYKFPFIYIQGTDMPHTWTSGWLPLAVASMISAPPPVQAP